jgi:basic membrane lipoprotein Med (substrate-binding protein (PBP1-ABC) superfamily)
MSTEDYFKAYKSGKRDYQARLLRGVRPTLEVLDDILPEKVDYSEVPLGLVQIPAEQIVGTKTVGRSNAFAGNYMPILGPETEFARKWAILSTSHVEEGIREPIKAYEYMNRFYVQEGNKRVSVMKFFDVVSIPGDVIRIVPKKTEEKENRLYYEFMDFYELSKVNYIWFSHYGSFQKLQKAVKKSANEPWSDDDKLMFSSVYTRFMAEYKSNGGQKLAITPGDAFLAFIGLYGYETLQAETTSNLKRMIKKSWEEFKLLEEEEEIDLKMNPTNDKKPILSRLLSLSSPRIKIGFIYARTVANSAWTYGHELGRLHLEQTFPDEVSTVYYENTTEKNIDEVLEQAIQEGCTLIFTTTPAFAKASVKAAIDHPNVRILNCSLNTSHRYIRTYYARMHEAKFLMGAVAGAMAENDRIAYVEDYPIYGSIANINAFALGAKMINPRAQVFLEWSSRKDFDLEADLKLIRPTCISGKDMVIPEEATRLYGVHQLKEGVLHNVAMPLWHWGKFYEQLIRTIMDGTWKYHDNPGSNKAINYWWGISAGVVDIICSKNLPAGTRRLVELLKQTISTGQFNPFSGILYAQNGAVIQKDPNGILAPEEIVTMDWLAENVIGAIPKKGELQEKAKQVVKQQGVRTIKEG